MFVSSAPACHFFLKAVSVIGGLNNNGSFEHATIHELQFFNLSIISDTVAHLHLNVHARKLLPAP